MYIYIYFCPDTLPFDSGNDIKVVYHIIISYYEFTSFVPRSKSPDS